MSYMFHGASSFNGGQSDWDVSSVTNMGYMFYEASSYNQDISSWDVSNVTYMSYMFYEANGLSDENQCAIHTSFQSNPVWPYDTCDLAYIYQPLP